MARKFSVGSNPFREGDVVMIGPDEVQEAQRYVEKRVSFRHKPSQSQLYRACKNILNTFQGTGGKYGLVVESLTNHCNVLFDGHVVCMVHYELLTIVSFRK